MCGITGVLALGSGLGSDGGPAPDPGLDGAVAALGHRGPDEIGRYVDDRVALGHTRLSIVDLSSGQQPMPNADGSVWVVFNGEIYNHVELRAELGARGHQFRTRSDTEVIAAAYEAYGLDFPHHFNGQFSIGLWDRRRRRLVLVRDRMGVRPLYYGRSADRLAFASEVKALRGLLGPGAALRLDPHTLAQVFTFWGPLSPRSPFLAVESLPPGHLLIAEGDGVQVRRYWDWRLARHPDQLDLTQLDRVAEELRALLVDAVRLRLRSDVPVGAYLSGGLDSSIITTLIKTRTDSPLRTFSLRFADAEYDESTYQRALIEHLQADHSSVTVSRRDIGREFPRTVWATECPVLRTAPTPMLLLSRLVRQSGYKVVLTGEGADEVFGGYDLFKEAQIRRFWARRPDSKLRPALLGRLYPYLGTSPASAAAYAESFFRQGLDRPEDPFFAHLPRWNTTRRSWGFFSPELRDALQGVDPIEDLRATLPADFAAWPGFARDQYVEGRTLLSEYLLSSQGDRVGMASSIEGRFPFLDHRVLELSARLAPELKMLGLKEKFILKRAFAELLPPAILRRPKQPYRAPDSASFFDEERPLGYVAELLDPGRVRQAGYFDPTAVARLYEKCRRGKASGAVDNQTFVGILSTMLADELFVRGTSLEDLERASQPVSGGAPARAAAPSPTSAT